MKDKKTWTTSPWGRARMSRPGGETEPTFCLRGPKLTGEPRPLPWWRGPRALTPPKSESS